MYSCLYLSKREFYTSSKDLLPFVEGLHYVICTYNSAARNTTIFRDEDVAYPPHFDSLNVLPPQEILRRLQENIERFENAPA